MLYKPEIIGELAHSQAQRGAEVLML